MKQLNQYKYILLLLMISVVACKKIITVNLNDAAPAFVIQGEVTNEPKNYGVHITRSINYTKDNIFPGVTGAFVTIKDDSTNTTDTLSGITGNDGFYATSKLTGAIGHTYHLYVKVEGKEFMANSTMPKQVMLDSIAFFSNSGFGRTVTNPLPNFQDPIGVYNAYRFIESINNLPYKRIYVFDDRLSDGKYISRQLFNDSSYIQKQDTVQLEMQCIDKNVFSYLKELSGQDPTNGQPTSPANPTSNISNGALGYFSAHTVQRKKAVFK